MCNFLRKICRVFKVCKHKGLIRKVTSVNPSVGNLADDVVTVLTLLNTHPFVQKVSLAKGKSLTVLLYTEHQLADMHRFCSAATDDTPWSVLGVDRTINLGQCLSPLSYTLVELSSGMTCKHMLLSWVSCFHTGTDSTAPTSNSFL